MNKIFINNIGDLAEAQRASFYKFLFIGISEELNHFPNPFFARIKVSPRKKVPSLVYFYPNLVKLKGPNASIDTCNNNDISYTIQLYIPGEYSYFLKSKYRSKILKTKLKSKLKKSLVEKNLRTTNNLNKKANNNLRYKNYFKNFKIQKITKKINCFNQLLIQKFKNFDSETKFIKFKKRKLIRVKQDIFLGEIPLMTDEGTFIVNGCERVVISQIIRSPGIYFRKEFAISSRKPTYTATIISNKGLWTKFVFDTIKFDEKSIDRIYIKLNDFKNQSNTIDDKEEKKEKLLSNKDKIFIFDLLKYFGLNITEVLDNSKYPEHLEEQQLGNNILDESENLALIKKFFLNPNSGGFSIGEIGRYKINKKLNVNLPKDIDYLTIHDFLGIIDGLIELKYYDRANDDIDDFKNKLIRSVGDLLQIQVRIAFYKLQKSVRLSYNYDTMSPIISNVNYNTKEIEKEVKNKDIIIPSPNLNVLEANLLEIIPEQTFEQWILDPRAITGSLKDFFVTSQLSQYMDQINPLAELTHKRRVSVFGPNGLKRDHISNVIRDIHPSQYGRFCPIETPEGQNAGLINAIAMYGRISSLGTIETPYFFMENGKVYSSKRPIFLNPEQESNTRIAFCDVGLNNANEIIEQYLSVKENYAFSVKKKEDINFITMSPIQIVSLGTSLIPFLEHDDANRALMGSNMQRQAVPLLYPKKAIIGTGLESNAILDSGMVTKTYSEGSVLYSSSQLIKIKDKNNQIICYYLKKYFRSNQETSINQRPLVWNNEIVFSGQLISDGPSCCDGELALGTNLITAYMPWEGYNYEDAIVINERLILDDCLTSVHIEEYETNLTNCFAGDERITRKLPQLTKFIRRHLNKRGIARIGSYVQEHDILIGKLTPCEEDRSAERRLYKMLYPEKVKKKNYRDTSLRVSSGTEGRIIDIRTTFFSTVSNFKQKSVKNNNIVENNKKLKTEIKTKYDDENSKPNKLISITSEVIKIYIAQVRKIKIGDKLAGRHGNKGIISRVLPSIDMPYLPDGTPIDILLNPLGVPSRMNVGQVFECLLGFAGEKLGKRFFVSSFDEIYGVEASRTLVNQKLKQAAIKTNQNWIFNPLFPGKIMLRDGRTGEYFDNPITVGRSYILKLIHLVDDKIHARSTGPYAMITEQPLAGKSQKGGQRFGEMEVWALEAYGCANTLQELLTIKSDDIDGRNDMYESILLKNEKPSPSIPESFLTLMRELNALGLNFSMNKISGGIYSTKNIKKVEKDIFKEIELKLKLRSVLSRYKAEYFSKSEILNEISNKKFVNKIEEKKKILEKFKKYSKFEN